MEYECGLELERVNVDEGYKKDNCTWMNRRSQVNNTRVNRVIYGYGINLTVSEWCYLLKIEESGLLDDRINHLKWKGDLEDILKTPIRDRSYSLLHKGEIKSASAIFREEGCPINKRNKLGIEHGGFVGALKSLGIDFSIVKPREKDYLTFEEGLCLLGEDTSGFGKNLYIKIRVQMEEK